MIVFSIASIATLTSCQKQDPPTIAEQLVGKWTMKTAIGSYVLNGDKTNGTTNFTADDYFEFKADGTVTIVETNQTYKGNWKITNDKLVFTNTNYMDYAIAGYTIKILTANDLQLYYAEQTNPNASLEQWLNLAK